MVTRRAPLLALVAGAAVLLLTACGSTVQVRSQTELLGTGDSGGASQFDAGAGAAVGVPGAAARGATSGSGPGATGSVAAAGGAVGVTPRASTAATTAAGMPESGRGFTRTTISIGAGVQDDANQYASTLGLAVSVGDTRAQIKALVDDINRRGGVLGRKLLVVFHNTPTADGNTNPTASAAQACTDWTEDHKVVAVLNTVAAINNKELFACLAKHDTPLLFGDTGIKTRADFDRWGSYLYAPTVLTVERLVGPLVTRLAAQDYFHAWDTLQGAPGTAPVKVGLLYDESIPASKTYVDLVKKELARRGIAAPDTVGISGDLSTMGSQLSSAVLRFKQDGITHVMPGNLFFMQAAEQAQYRPRYAITSNDAPGLQQTTLTASQLEGALGVGHLPGVDVDSAHQGPDVSPAQGRCRRLMQRAGQETGNALTFLSMAIKCDLYFAFYAAAEAAKGLSTTAFRQGFESVGQAFASATTFRSRFGSGRHDGAAGVRDLGYDLGCSCFTYRGPVTGA